MGGLPRTMSQSYRASMRGGAVGRGVAAVAVLVTVVSGACAAPPPPSGPLPSPAGTSGRPCSAAAVHSCALPFPSDEWTQPDPTMPNGRRLALPAELIPAPVLNALGPGASVADVNRDADGFSAVGPVIFELSTPVDPWVMPADGGDLVRVFDVATGAPVATRVEVSSELLRTGAPNPIIMAWPQVRWEPGHTYVARLVNGPTSPLGAQGRPAGLDGPEGSFIGGVRAQLTDIEGDRWSSVLGATRFTVRSTASATSQIVSMSAIARAADHPVRNLTVDPALLTPSGSAAVKGEVRLSDFRDRDGVARVANGATDTWVPFYMVLPARPASSAGAPVVLYGHGLLASKETMVLVAESNARRGLATIGVDVPNHGERQDGQGGFLLDITTSRTLGRLVSMPLQGEVDTVSLAKAVTTHLADLDVAGTGTNGWEGPDGHHDLDTTRLLYEGTSMGGVLGASSITQIPELDGAYLQVPGSGIADILYHSQLWVFFAGIIPSDATVGDAAALKGVATLLIDPAENSYVLDRLRDGGPPLFVQYGVGDGVVPNPMTERLATLAGLPFVGPEISPLHLPFEHTGSDAIPADGRGMAQVYPLNSSAETSAFMAHLSFGEPAAEVILDGWLVNRLHAMGLAPHS